MTWIAVILSAMTVLLLGVMLLVMPAITLRTLPLGVSVPQAHTGDPAVRSAVRRYRTGVVAAAVLSLALAAVLSGFAPIAGTLVPTLAMVVLGAAAYLAARRGIQRAKREGGWYDDVPVRLSASVTPDRAARVAIAPAWYLVALVVLGVVAAIGVAIYPTLPNPLPIHWNAAGRADGYAEKSIWSVFGALLTAVGLVVLLYVVALASRVSPARVRVGGDPQTAAARTHAQLHVMQELLGWLALVLALMMGVVALLGWLAPAASGAMSIAVVAMVVLVFALLVLFLMRYRRASTAASGSPAVPHVTRAATPDAPDDDRFWKLGVFYVNRNDPATMVPKRFGVGWTVNLGSPGGMAVGILIVLIAVAAIVVGIVAPGHHIG